MDKAYIRSTAVSSKFGDVNVVWREDESGAKVVEILLPARGTRLAQFGAQRAQHPSIDRLCDAVSAYLEGKDVELPTDYLDWARCSPFQRSVLVAERTIPRGHVSSYNELAEHIGRPGAARAVGTALARNPFPIVVPCHRTLRSDGSLGGFGGGLHMKKALLEMEGVVFDRRGRVGREFFWDWDAGP